MLVFVGDVGFSLWISLVAGGRVGVGVGVGVLPTFSLLRLASCVFALRAEESNLADKGFLYAVLCPYLLRMLILQGGRS